MTHAAAKPDLAQQAKANPNPALLEKVITQSLLPTRHTDGIAIGVLDAFDANGKALVSIATFGLSALSAISLVPLNSAHLGAQLALGFESGDTQRPIILGLILSAAQPTAAPQTEANDEADSETGSEAEPLDLIVDGQHIVLQAEREIELRCGDAAIILSADGHIQLRGTYITSHASATQRILGGSVNVN
jgi:hypothetical protein